MMRVAELWRYPVKSLAGERLERAELTGNGIVGERGWPGRRLRIADALIAVEKVRGRCVMTTYDPDTQVQDLSVLKRIVSEFGGRMALDCDVLEGGVLRVGDPVAFV